ncbi:MAG: efflux RND transporter periplasmic adaptor subunit [Planctomycetes bacterium]|nr:efflux RND transporter periplasmic adaptor subunit [Planctomycetota bacterium]MCB9918272.1 efflux RND transporter periplasmic adaptor subunit [Planctomycetota bacterium]
MDVQALKIDRRETASASRRPRRRRGRFAWFAVFVLLLAALGFAFRDRWIPLVDAWRLTEVAVENVVRAHPAAAGAIAGTSANGHVVAARRAALSADTPGRIVALEVTEGSVVKKGAVVARLFAEEHAAALDRAQADVVAAKAAEEAAEVAVRAADNEIERRRREATASRAAVKEASARAALAEGRYRRAASLQQEDAGSRAAAVDAEAEWNAARAAEEFARAQVEVAEATIRDASQRAEISRAELASAVARIHATEAAAELARATLEKTIVRAPFDGIVVLKDAEVGEVVSPNSFGASNARGAVCTMVDFASLEAQADLPETSLAKVAVDMPATIFLDAYPDQPYRGRVSRIWPTADRQQATVEVRVQFDERDDKLRPEMGLRIVFASEEATEQASAKRGEDAPPPILIDESAVLTSNGRNGVFVVERDIVRFREVDVGERRGGRIAVRAGLTVGERIVVSPPPRLEDGDRVRVPKT